MLKLQDAQKFDGNLGERDTYTEAIEKQSIRKHCFFDGVGHQVNHACCDGEGCRRTLTSTGLCEVKTIY